MTILKQIVAANATAFSLSLILSGAAIAQPTIHQSNSTAHNQLREKLQSVVDLALKARRINADQAEELQAELFRNFDYQKSAMLDGSLSSMEREELLEHLQSITSRLDSMMANQDPSKFTYDTARTRLSDEVNAARSALEAKVSSALTANQITQAQGAALRALLSSNTTQQALFMVDGKIDATERDELTKGLEAASKRLDSIVRINVSNNSRGQISFYDRDWWNQSWNNGLTSGMLARLSKLSERIERAKIQGRLTSTEYATLKEELDKLSVPDQFGFSDRNTKWNRAGFETAVNSLELRVRKEINSRENAYRGRLF